MALSGLHTWIFYTSPLELNSGMSLRQLGKAVVSEPSSQKPLVCCCICNLWSELLYCCCCGTRYITTNCRCTSCAPSHKVGQKLGVARGSALDRALNHALRRTRGKARWAMATAWHWAPSAACMRCEGAGGLPSTVRPSLAHAHLAAKARRLVGRHHAVNDLAVHCWVAHQATRRHLRRQGGGGWCRVRAEGGGAWIASSDEAAPPPLLPAPCQPRTAA